MSAEIFSNGEVFRIHCTVRELPDRAHSPSDPLFLQLFDQMLSATSREDADHWRANLESLLLHDKVQAIPVDLARFYFLSGCLHLGYNRPKPAFDTFNLCLESLDQNDVASRLQVLLKLVSVKLRLHHYVEASGDFLDILLIIQGNYAIQFDRGDLDSLRCHCYIQLSQAYLNIGEFDAARNGIIRAITFIDGWLQQVMEVTILDTSPDRQEFPYIPLQDLPKPVFESKDTVANTWLIMYHLAFWVYTDVIRWDTALNAFRDPDVLRAASEWLHEEIENNMHSLRTIDEYPEAPPALQQGYRQSARMSLLVVESIFVLCEVDPPVSFGLLAHAKTLLEISEEVDIRTPSNDQYTVLELHRQLLRLTLEGWLIEVDAASHGFGRDNPLPTKFADEMDLLLARIVEATPVLTGEPGILQLRGRYLMQQARLLHRLGQTDAALHALDGAQRCFEQQGSHGHFLRMEEISQLRDQYLLHEEDADVEDEAD